MSLDDMFNTLDKQQALQQPAALPTPTAQTSPLENALDMVDRDKKLRATNNLADAQQIAPDQAARALQVSKTIGMPVPAVEENLDEAHKSAQLQQNVSTLDDSPKLTQFIADNPLAARLAQDDMENLSAFEKLMRHATGAPRALAAGLTTDFNAAIWGWLEAGAKAIGAETPAEYFHTYRKQQESLGQRIQGEYGTGGGLEAGIASGFRSFGGQASGTLASVLTGNPAFMLGTGSAVAGGQAVSKGLEAGIAPLQAINYGMQDAVAEWATEMIPVGRLLKDLNVGAPFLKVLGHQMVTEVPTELAATAWQNFNEWANVHPDQTLGQYMDQLGPDEAQTVLATVTQTVLSAGLAHGSSRIFRQRAAQGQKADQAAAAASTLQQIDDLTKASKLRQRDPDTFNEFVKHLSEEGPVQELYISPQAFMQSGVDVGKLTEAIPAIAKQMESASAGNDIRIPIDEYLTKIAGTDMATALTPHLKTEVDGMSQSEAEQYLKTQGEQIKADVEKTLTEQNTKAEFQQSLQRVQENVLGQLEQAGRFTTNVNQLYSNLIGARFATLAQQMNITPEEAFALKPLKIQAEGAQGNVLLQEELAQDPTEENAIQQAKVTAQASIKQAHEEGNIPEKGAYRGLYIEELRKIAETGVLDIRSNAEGESVIAATPLENGKLNGAVYGAGSGYLVPTEALEHGGKLQHAGEVWIEPKTNAKKLKYLVNGKLMTFSEMKEAVLGKNPQKSQEVKDAEQWLKDFLEGKGSQLQQGEGNRGSYSPDTNTITLFKNADLSTFLHETGHFFLDLQAHLATLPNAPQQIHDDTETLLEWFGVKATPELSALDAWHAMSLDEQREAHEKFARGFEAYLFEGKAPNVELQGVFSRFRAWLINIYKAIKNLNVELTPEVRSVMDRMLATQEEIEAKQAADSMGMMFKTQEEANKFGVDWAKYHALAQDSTAKAVDELTARSLKDMQWFENAKGRELKRLQKDAAEKRAEVKREIRPNVLSSQLYRTWAFLTGKQEMVTPGTQAEIDTTQASGKLRLNVEGMDIDDATKARLRSLHMTSEENGMHPDIVAELFGYSSGSELIQQIVSNPTPNEAVNMETDRVMLERYGDLTSQEALNNAATEVVHNTLRQKLVAAELKALESAEPKEKRGRAQVKTLPRAAKMFAEGLVNKLKVRDIKPRQYEVAESKAAREAEKAVKAGKTEEAATQKRNQLINGYATRAALDAQAEVEAARRYFRKFESDSARKAIDASYTDQIDQLLERYEFRAVPLKTLEKRRTLAEWLEKQHEMGLEPDIPADLVETTNVKNYRDMTMEELRGLVDTVKQIEHLGRLKNRLLTSQAQREYAAARDEMVAGIKDNSRGRKAETRSPNTILGEKLVGLKNFWASHIKAATWARIMDGGKDGGPIWEYLIRPANDAGNKEVVARAKATEDLTHLMKPVLQQGHMGGKGQFFPTINRSMNREARIAMALNTGNEGNLQRLLDGEGWTLQQITPVLDTLTKEDWNFVQSVWDYFETFRPEIAAKERRVYGKEPEWIKPKPVQTKFGEYAGGYYPIKYDPRASSRAEEHADAETARQLLKGAYTSATTKRSFTKTRAEQVRGRPLMYSLDGIYSGVNEIIHDLAWHEWLIDVNRLLKSESLSTAMRETYGPEVHKQFKDWARDIAVGNPELRSGEKAIAWLRQGVSVSGLGLNVMSALVQPFGITQSIVRIGPKWVGRGIAKAIGSPIETTKQINEKSEFMATRYMTRMRELAELRNRVRGQSEARRMLDSTAYFLMLRAQQLVDVPTWWGSYEKAIAEGNDEKRSVALADQAVIDSQGSGTEKDQAAIERGTAALKLFTVFYSFQNTALNLGVAQTMTAQSKAKLAADYLLLYVAPVLLMTAMKEALVPGGDDDPDKLAKKMVSEELAYLFGLMFMVREFSGAIQMATGTNEYPADYQGPAGVRMISDITKLGKQVGQGDIDDGLRKAVVNVGSELLRLPGAQINRTISGAEALHEGDTKNPTALLFGYQKQ